MAKLKLYRGTTLNQASGSNYEDGSIAFNPSTKKLMIKCNSQDSTKFLEVQTSYAESSGYASTAGNVVAQASEPTSSNVLIWIKTA